MWVICNLWLGRGRHEEWLDHHHYKDIQTLINNRQNNRRRGRGGGPRPNGVNSGNDRGNRIDNRARGNANQLYEKYKTLARDAQMQGDRVMSEYYYQFADHYFRVLSENRPRFEDQRRGRDDQFDRDDQDDFAEEADGAPEGSNANNGNNGSYSERNYQRRPGVEQESAAPEPAQRSERIPAPAVQAANGHDEHAEPETVPAQRRQARGRRPRTESAPLLAPLANDDERIEVDRLPPSFTPAAGSAEQDAEASTEAAPKRRGRRPRSASIEA